MANIKSAKKRARQAIVKSARNSQTKSSVRTAEKKLRSAISAGKKEDIQDLFRKYSSAIGKAAQKGIYHANTASRKISRIATLMNK